LLEVLPEAQFILHGWLRSGNCGTSRGVVEVGEFQLRLHNWKQPGVSSSFARRAAASVES
jgi:hypothetical protein